MSYVAITNCPDKWCHRHYAYPPHLYRRIVYLFIYCTGICYLFVHWYPSSSSLYVTQLISSDLDDYGKPLPPPPLGFYWSRLDDGSWEVLEFAPREECGQEDFITVEKASMIEHVVMPSDTLQGKCSIIYSSLFINSHSFGLTHRITCAISGTSISHQCHHYHENYNWHNVCLHRLVSGVSAVSLRQANTFSGSAFRSRKVLRIPLEPG